VVEPPYPPPAPPSIPALPRFTPPISSLKNESTPHNPCPLLHSPKCPSPPSFTALLTHPAPTLVFGAHPDINIPSRLIPSPHRLHRRPGLLARRRLRKLLAPLDPALFADLIDFYSRADGFDLCLLPDPLNGGHRPAFRLLPLAHWHAATEEFNTGLRAWELEDLRDIYAPGSFRIIAASGSEGIALALHLGDKSAAPNANTPIPAGALTYLALDPTFSFMEAVAPSFSALLDWLARDPIRFFGDIGFSSAVQAPDGKWYGDVPEAYFPDLHTAPTPTPP
jgi:hypothetical protein